MRKKSPGVDFHPGLSLFLWPMFECAGSVLHILNNWLSQESSRYYIDRSVLLENAPLVKFIRNNIMGPSVVFSISSLMTSFPTFSRFFAETVGEKWRVDLSI